MQNLSSLPDNFTGPAAWRREDLQNSPDSWLVTLSQQQIEELEQAASHYLATGKDIGEISASQFKLGDFSTHLRALKHKLLNGLGVEVIRGLPVRDYSPELAACIFCGIGSHLGSARSQNAAGHVLGHVRDLGMSSNNPTTRIYQTAERQSFHTDSADVVGLLCWQDAKSGGESMLVSALTIVNQFRKARPDLLPLLFEPVATDRRGEIPAGQKPFMEIPVLNWYRGFLTVFYQRQYINSAARFEQAPPLTEAHREALDLFDSFANDSQLNFSMQLQPGDMQFVYNHSQLHDRSAFVDWEEPGKQRHLLRLWLSIEGDRPLPEYFKQRYGSIEIGNRGGIITKETRLHAPLWE